MHRFDFQHTSTTFYTLTLFHVATNNKQRVTWSQVQKQAKNMVEFTTDSLKQQLSSKRNYTMFLLVTAQDSKELPCPTCKDVSSNFNQVRHLYLKALGSEGTSSSVFSQNPILFGKCDVRKCYEIMMQIQLQSIPSIVFVPTRSTESSSEQLQLMPEAVSASTEEIADFVSKKSGFQLQTNLQYYAKFGYVTAGILAIYLLFFQIIPYLRNSGSHPAFWFLICMVKNTILCAETKPESRLFLT